MLQKMVPVNSGVTDGGGEVNHSPAKLNAKTCPSQNNADTMTRPGVANPGLALCLFLAAYVIIRSHTKNMHDNKWLAKFCHYHVGA